MDKTLLVRRDAIAQARVREQDDRPLAPGQVRVAIDLLALTANNITYAAFGEAMDYWRFFPSGEDGWGILPAWGFGRVVQSLHPGVAAGERLYGFWPAGSGAILQPDRLSAAGVRDAAPHRAGLHGIYNQYLRCNADPLHRAGREGIEAVLRPLFMTSWLIDDFLADEGFFGARRVLLSSASSKTAWGTAFLLARRKAVEVVGFTSPARRAFCEGLGCYDRVLAYGDLATLPAGEPCVYVDFSGDAGFRRDLHQRFGDALRHSSAVGGTHVDKLGGGKGLPGPRPTLFFAPAQARKRQEQWGGAVLQERMAQDWERVLAAAGAASPPWLELREHEGAAGLLAAYSELVRGDVDPRQAHVLALR